MEKSCTSVFSEPYGSPAGAAGHPLGGQESIKLSETLSRRYNALEIEGWLAEAAPASSFPHILSTTAACA